RAPGLADRRGPRPLDLLPGLGAADLLDPRADLGHERDQRVVTRRLAAPGPHHVLRPRLGVHRARLPRHGAAAPGRPRARRLVAHVTEASLAMPVSGRRASPGGRLKRPVDTVRAENGNA